jgi:hypothetical protein
MHCACQRLLQCGFGLRQFNGVFCPIAHAKAHVQIFGPLRRLFKSLGRAEHKTKAITRHQILRTRSGDQQAVLVGGVGDQAAEGLCRHGVTLRV